MSNTNGIPSPPSSNGVPESVDRASSKTPTAMNHGDSERKPSPTAESIAPEQVPLLQSSASNASCRSEAAAQLPPPRPRYFACRSDGTLTPLIAVDELPPTLTLVGVPRKLSMAETMGMTSVGTVPNANSHYKILMAPHPISGKQKEPSVRSPATTVSRPPTIAADQEPRQGGSKEDIDKWRDGISIASIPESNAITTPTTPPTPPTPPSPSANGNNTKYTPYTPGVLGRKEYCSHWIRTGQCDFNQQGCLFKHEMPNVEKLAELGWQQIPRWFRELGGLPQGYPSRGGGGAGGRQGGFRNGENRQAANSPAATATATARRGGDENWRNLFAGTGAGRGRGGFQGPAQAAPTPALAGGTQQPGRTPPFGAWHATKQQLSGNPGFPPTRQHQPQPSRPTVPPWLIRSQKGGKQSSGPRSKQPSFQTLLSRQPGSSSQSAQTSHEQSQRPSGSSPPLVSLTPLRSPTASSVRTAHSAMTMSIFAQPPAGQQQRFQLPSPRRGEHASSYQPLEPLPLRQQGPVRSGGQSQPPVSSSSTSRSQQREQNAGDLFASAPAAPAPIHRRRFEQEVSLPRAQASNYVRLLEQATQQIEGREDGMGGRSNGERERGRELDE